jgi:hypothetical protein
MEFMRRAPIFRCADQTQNVEAALLLLGGTFHAVSRELVGGIDR